MLNINPSPSPPLSSRPLTSLTSIILVTGSFILIWSRLKTHIESSGPIPIFDTITTLNSRIYALFSLILALLILQPKLPSSLTGLFPKSPQDRDLRYIYHLSKFYEYIDVINLVASGHPIGEHMAFHHLTTPLLTYFRVLNIQGQWEVFAFLNCLHHFFMYAYFGGVTGFRVVLKFTGWIQLVGGVGVDLWWLLSMWFNGEKRTDSATDEESFNRIITVSLLVRYGMLYARELRDGSRQKRLAQLDISKEQDKD